MKVTRIANNLFCLSGGVLLSACTSMTMREEAPIETREPPPVSSPTSIGLRSTLPARAPEEIKLVESDLGTPISAAATATLLAQADQLAEFDQYERAGATLERAISIEPENPVVWHRLAALRLREQRYDQVIAMAQKSNRYAGDWVPLQIANWELIAEAKTAIGDAEGAEAAWAQTRELGAPAPSS